jgi:hypothetical protein
MIEVFGVMPSCRISCTPITAPKTHSTIKKTNVAGAKVEGCRASAACGTAPVTAAVWDRSVIGIPQPEASERLRYRSARPVCLSLNGGAMGCRCGAGCQVSCRRFGGARLGRNYRRAGHTSPGRKAAQRPGRESHRCRRQLCAWRKVSQASPCRERFVYVLSGAVRSENSATGRAKVYTAGESFFEPSGSEHLVSKNPSAAEPASLLAVFVADDGAQLMTFDK